MKINPALFKLSMQAIKGKNRIARMFVICVLVLTALPMVLTGISESLLQETRESRWNVYGMFTDILYFDDLDIGLGDLDKTAEEQLRGLSEYSCGFLYTLFTQQAGDICINAGYADEMAVKLGRIRLAKGRFPESGNEIALTESAAERIAGEGCLNKQVQVGEDTWVIVGLVKDYGRLWPVRTQVQNSGLGRINVFLTKEKAVELESSANSRSAQILVYRESDEVIAPENGEMIKNVNGEMRSSEAAFRLPKGFLFMLYVCEVVIFYNILLLSYEKNGKRCRIYMLMGMSRREAAKCLLCELTFLFLGGTALGFGAGFCITAVGLHFLSRMTASNLMIAGMGSMALSAGGFLLLAAFCLGIYVSKMTRGLDDARISADGGMRINKG